MLYRILHASQWCYRHNLNRLGAFFSRLISFLYAADIPGNAEIHPYVSFSHVYGININPTAEIGEGCIIGSNVTLGNAFPHGGAPKLGKHVYIGNGAFLGGNIHIADYVIVGANSVLTKSIEQSGVVIAGNPARIIRNLTEKEIEMLNW